MLRWALVFFMIAFFTAVAGFLGIAAALSGFLKFVFILSVFLFLSLLAGPLIRPPQALNTWTYNATFMAHEFARLSRTGGQKNSPRSL